MTPEQVEDILKTQFVRMALQGDDPFAKKVELPEDLRAAVEWTMARSSEEADHERELIMQQIERAAEELKTSGAVDAWFAGADPGVRKVNLQQ